jgi:phosphatidylinositol kinase/protein kinase (PI-3  family)
MSMVGYILGLGDRHPSNLMMNRNTGTIVHIDFGDCFEVAMHRERFPERIPFRLTRMLVSAMGVCGIEGTFRTTCEQVMSVLRENASSLTSVLESFIYDPLASWRILKQKHRQCKQIYNLFIYVYNIMIWIYTIYIYTIYIYTIYIYIINEMAILFIHVFYIS